MCTWSYRTLAVCNSLDDVELFAILGSARHKNKLGMFVSTGQDSLLQLSGVFENCFAKGNNEQWLPYQLLHRPLLHNAWTL